MSKNLTIQQREIPRNVSDELPNSMPLSVRRILLARNVYQNGQLDLSFKRLIPPGSLGGLESAANMLAEAVLQQKSILIVGDFDADGATGTALAVRLLSAFGAQNVSFKVPNRFEFGYGLTPGLVNTLKDAPPDVLVTVDSGIACIAGVAKARSLGIQVIVTDHHLPGKQLPDAHAIVNPNAPGDEFPSKNLAGVGVVFYLMSAVRRSLISNGHFGRSKPPNLAHYLDLVALGTVADVVPLDENNRVLVNQGLERIRAGIASPGLLALLKAGKRDYRHVVASDLGFAVGPRLNAAGRLEDMAVGIRCLMTDDVHEAAQLAGQLNELNAQRKTLQQTMQAEAAAQVQAIIDALGQSLPFSLCLTDDRWHQGIVGLVASRIKEATHRPVVALAPESEGAEVLKGSARSIPGLHIRDVLAHVDAQHPGLIVAFGGHAMAAGLTLPREGLDVFTQAMEASVKHFLDHKTPQAQVLTDGCLEANELCLDTAELLQSLGPWGQRFPEPVFDGLFEVVDQRIVGGAHLKLLVRPMDGHEVVDAIAFGKLPEDLPATPSVRLLYRLDVNRFRGSSSAQLMVEHILAP